MIQNSVVLNHDFKLSFKIGLIIKLVSVGLMYQIGHSTENGIKIITKVTININKYPEL